MRGIGASSVSFSSSSRVSDSAGPRHASRVLGSGQVLTGAVVVVVGVLTLIAWLMR